MANPTQAELLKRSFGQKEQPRPFTEPVKDPLDAAMLYREITMNWQAVRVLKKQYTDANPAGFRTNPNSFDRPIPLQIVVTFGDELKPTVESFSTKIDYVLRSRKHFEPTEYYSIIDAALREHAAKRFPKKEFVTPWLGRYDLCYKQKHVQTRARRMRADVEKAHRTGAPMEIGYNKSGANFTRPEDSIAPRHVNIHSVGSDWFTVLNELGFRTYSFDKLSWTAVSGKERREVAPHTLRMEASDPRDGAFTLKANLFLDGKPIKW